MRFEGYTVSDDLHVSIDGGNYTLLKPIIVYNDNWIEVMQIPVGFVTDFASIPPYLQFLAPKHGPGLRRAAVVHDFLYRTVNTGSTKKDADDIFRAIMKSKGASHWRMEARYRAVRLFGGSSYKGDV